MAFAWRRANQAMVILNLGAGALLMFSMFKGAPGENPAIRARETRRIDAVLSQAQSAAPEEKVAPRRDLFRSVYAPSAAPKPTPAARAPAAPRVPLAERAAHLRLVGIVNGQAMVEDTQANKTLYVSPGETIGELQVKEVSEGKIVVGFEGEQMEISL